jgi:nicotinamide-nucleotide amidase
VDPSPSLTPTPADAPVSALVQRLAAALLARRWLLATAESCTGGLIAAACTGLAGSSEWFDRGFVTYSNEAKQDMLGVDAGLIRRHGAVSREVALAMAAGALLHSRAHVAVAVTGIAGPGGGTPDKPVGTVWLATAVDDGAAQALHLQLPGDRAAVRQATVQQALQRLLALLPQGDAANPPR